MKEYNLNYNYAVIQLEHGRGKIQITIICKFGSTGILLLLIHVL